MVKVFFCYNQFVMKYIHYDYTLSIKTTFVGDSSNIRIKLMYHKKLCYCNTHVQLVTKVFLYII